jgi:hypothetical protein
MGGGLKWLGGRPMVIFFSVLLGCYVFDMVYPAVAGILRGNPNNGSRASINASIRDSSMALAVLGMLAVASTAAVSLTGEREQDTWTSLATTLLTPSEIVRGKQFGGLWSARRIGLALLLLWSVGIVLGAIHPLGVLVAGLIVGLACWFIAAFGVFVSSRARNSTRALSVTFITLFIAFYAWPGMLRRSLFSYDDVAALWTDPRLEYVATRLTWSFLRMLTGISAIYAIAGLVFTLWSIRRLRATWGRA